MPFWRQSADFGALRRELDQLRQDYDHMAAKVERMRTRIYQVQREESDEPEPKKREKGETKEQFKARMLGR